MKQLCLGIMTFLFSISVFAAPKKDLSQSALLAELKGQSPQSMSELELYTEVVNAFDGKRLKSLELQAQSFLQKHPLSPRADNVLFMQATLHAEKKNYAKSLRAISLIEQKYAQSNRHSAALFLKAMIFKNIHLPEQSRAVLLKIRETYPRSPEFYRAEAELRILQNQVN